jgi:hypothetical protein
VNEKFSDIPCIIKERHGFIKKVCNDENPWYTYKCLNSEKFYFQKYKESSLVLFGQVCSNDPYFYQACDKRLGGRILTDNNNGRLCESYLCKPKTVNYILPFPQLDRFNYICNGKLECTNTNLDEVGCTYNAEYVTMTSGEKALLNDICDDECDTKFCEDEANCNGYTYGLYCKRRRGKIYKFYYVAPLYVCSSLNAHSKLCDNNEDTADCELEESAGRKTCKHIISGKMVPVFNYTQCGPISRSTFKYKRPNSYCRPEDIIAYQSNCTDPSKVGVICKINGYQSNI